MFCSKSSCGESFECWRESKSECAASRFRASLDRGIVAFDLINDDVVVVCTSGTSKEFVDDGLADPVDNSSFWASLFSFIFTPSSPSSVDRERRNFHINTWLGFGSESTQKINDSGLGRAVQLRLWIVDGAIRKQIFMQFASNFSSPFPSLRQESMEFFLIFGRADKEEKMFYG